MGIADWLGAGKNPVLDHLVQTYGLESARRGQAQGSARGKALLLSANKDGSGRAAIDALFGECAMDPCFGFYRPDDESLREAVDFGPGWFESFQQGTPVGFGRFLIDFEGELYWKPLLDRHGLAIAAYLGRYSQALRWAYVRFPGLEFALREPVPGEWKRSPDLKALERDIATSAAIIDFVLEIAAKEGIPPAAATD